MYSIKNIYIKYILKHLLFVHYLCSVMQQIHKLFEASNNTHSSFKKKKTYAYSSFISLVCYLACLDQTLTDIWPLLATIRK